MGDEDDGASGLAPNSFELFVQQVAGDGVEGGERFVHEQHLAVLRERTGQGDPLPHTAGELVRAFVGGVGEVDEVEQLERVAATVLARDPA